MTGVFLNISDHVDRIWSTLSLEVTLTEFLGMTSEQFNGWMAQRYLIKGWSSFSNLFFDQRRSSLVWVIFGVLKDNCSRLFFMVIIASVLCLATVHVGQLYNDNPKGKKKKKPSRMTALLKAKMEKAASNGQRVATDYSLCDFHEIVTKNLSLWFSQNIIIFERIFYVSWIPCAISPQKMYTLINLSSIFPEIQWITISRLLSRGRHWDYRVDISNLEWVHVQESCRISFYH